jgi:predicted transcriptional regulator
MELTTYQKIASVLSVRLHKMPETIADEVFTKHELWLKVSTIERRLREMAHRGVVTSKEYKNTHNSSSHSRWKRRFKDVGTNS